jgi:hypothetical protein
MQQTSALYKELLAGDYTVETRVAIGESGLLVEKTGDHITFGGTRILIATSGADGGYGANMLSSVETSGGLFDGDEPSCGNCISREVNIKMLKPIGQIPGLSRVGIYARITDGTRASEWLPQGVFFIDSIEEDAEDDDVRWLRIHGYDALLFSEQDYPSNTNLTWPAKDIDVVREIASALGVTVDKRTKNAMKNAYLVQYNTTYSCREYLSYIAAMYAGCFIMSETGELQLVCFWDIPKETRYLIDNAGFAITFGGDRIVV